jgi:uncharacterized repeat protein (TIGR01451 family)
VGEESYRTDVRIANTGSSTRDLILYRAGDCYLQGSDTGYGFTDTTRRAVGCSVNPNNSPPDRIEQWLPITGGNHYLQTGYSAVWATIGGQQEFPDTCDCTTFQDNGAGLSWRVTVPAASAVTVSHLTTFSPTGVLPLTTTKTADSSTSAPGGANGYTITVSNPNAAAASLNSITDTLPAGFTYTAGSTTGVTTTDPTIAGQTLTWSGPFAVAASSSISLHFGVTVASTPGQYFNEAGADASGGDTVSPTGPTAPITVGGGGASQLSIGDAKVYEGDSRSRIVKIPVTLSPASTSTVTVDFTTVRGAQATPPDDYTTTQGTLTFPPGTTTQQVSVRVHGNTQDEVPGPAEWFSVVLSNPQGATIHDSRGAVGIVMDDRPTNPARHLDIKMVKVYEGEGGSEARLMVTLSTPSTSPVTVHYETADGSATAPGDYTATSGDLTFAPGETSKAVVVAIAGDNLSEGTETLFVNLSAPTGAALNTSTGKVKIENGI